MLIAIHGVKLLAHYYTWIETLCSLLCMKLSVMLIAIHGLKLYVQCYRRSEAICSLLSME